MSEHWVALLRGINVGGHHKVPMAELRQRLVSAGFADVQTYIQSGNVLFRTDESTDEATLATSIADVVEDEFGFRVPVVVRPYAEIAEIAESHPDADGEVPPNWLLVFVLDGATASADDPDPQRFSPDTWRLGEREVYATYPDGPSRSKLTIDVFERAFDVTATARNLNTLRKIVAVGAPTDA